MRNIKGVTNSFEATLNFRQAGWRARFSMACRDIRPFPSASVTFKTRYCIEGPLHRADAHVLRLDHDIYSHLEMNQKQSSPYHSFME